MRHILGLSLLVILELLCANVVCAKEPYSPTAAEMVMLPPYCRAKMVLKGDRNNPEVRYWGERLGWKNFVHVHHYCLSINQENRALRARGKYKRNFYYNQAAGGYRYVLGAWEPNCVLRPEAHVRYGKLLQRMGRGAESAAHFMKAIELKSDYPAAYASLGDWYMRAGQRDEARNVLEKGLAQIPDSKLLKRRLQRLKKQ